MPRHEFDVQTDETRATGVAAYAVNLGGPGDRWTPGESPFVEGVRVSEVHAMADFVDGQWVWRDPLDQVQAKREIAESRWLMEEIEQACEDELAQRLIGDC